MCAAPKEAQVHSNYMQSIPDKIIIKFKEIDAGNPFFFFYNILSCLLSCTTVEGSQSTHKCKSS